MILQNAWNNIHFKKPTKIKYTFLQQTFTEIYDITNVLNIWLKKNVSIKTWQNQVLLEGQ